MVLKVISHRGNDGIDSKLIQNSLNALLNASEHNEFFGIEFDVRQTSDGILVLVHDEILGKIAPTEGYHRKKISDLTYDKLRQYQVSVRYGQEKLFMVFRSVNIFDDRYITNYIWEKTANSSTIGAVNDLFFDLALKGYTGECLFEIKDTSPKALLAMEKEINEYKGELDIRIHGRDIKAVEELGQSTKLPYGYIVDPNQTNRLTSKEIEKSSADFYSICRIQYFDLSPEVELLGIKNLVDNGKGINIWTVNSLPQLANVLWYFIETKRRYNIVPEEVTFISDFPTLIIRYLNDPTIDGWLIRKVRQYFKELDGTFNFTSVESSLVKTRKHPLQTLNSHK